MLGDKHDVRAGARARAKTTWLFKASARQWFLAVCQARAGRRQASGGPWYEIGGVPGAVRGLLSKRPQDEVKREAAAQNISWGTLKRASEGGEVIKRKDGFGAGARSFWGLS